MPAVAADPDAVVDLLRQQDDRMLRVGERLVVAGASLCTDSGRSAGMIVQYAGQYGAEYRPSAVKILGLGDIPTVSSVAPNSAAAAAGLRLGDQIESIDGVRFDPMPSKQVAGDYAPTARALSEIERAISDGTAGLTILRDGRRMSVTLTARPACHARFDVRAGRSSNATSDGATIQVSSDLVAEAQGDGELAAIVAHELAHNILRHPQRLKAKERGLGVKQTEIEADRLSVWLLDAAGYGPAGAISFWGRWGRAHDYGILSDGTHPGWRKRIATIEAENAAIAALRAAGRSLQPPPELRAR